MRGLRELERLRSRRHQHGLDVMGLKRLGNRGQLWSEYFGGVVVILGVAAVFILFNQIWVYTLHPAGVAQETDATSLGYLESAWTYFPFIIILAFIFSVLSRSKAEAGSAT